MIENKNNNINYRPNIEYTDDYYSEIELNDDKNDIDDGITTLPEIVPDIELDDTEDIVDMLPGELSGMIDEVFGPVKDFWEDEIKDKEYSRIPEEEDYHYEIKEPEEDKEEDNENEGSEDDEVGEEDFWETDDDIIIVPEENEKEEIIEKEYIKNLSDIIEDYNNKLKNTLSNFWIGIAITLKEDSFKGTAVWDNIIYKSSEVRQEYKHLLDFALTKQLGRSVKMDFYNNLFNVTQTVIHMKQVKVCYELRKRYASITTESIGDKKKDSINDNILDGVNIMYDIKYDKAIENLYRYLDSSVIMLDDILKTQLQEIKSKDIINVGKGVNK